MPVDGEFDAVDAAINKFAATLKIDPNLFALTTEKDDWVFVLKAAFLAECAVKQTIAWHLGGDSHLEAISRIELSRLIDLGKSLGIYHSESKRFVMYLASLRNDLIHNIHGHRFNLREHLKAESKRKALVQAVEPFMKPTIQIGEDLHVPKAQFAWENPKFGLVFGLIDLFAIGWWLFETKNQEAELNKLKENALSSYTCRRSSRTSEI